jgi:hypothetical protein
MGLELKNEIKYGGKKNTKEIAYFKKDFKHYNKTFGNFSLW